MSESRYGFLTDLGQWIYPAMPKKLPEGQALFRIKEAASYFDVHEKTLREMIARGEVKKVPVSERKNYIRREEILRYWREKSKSF
jgi:excisionase family DNA binding protein